MSLLKSILRNVHPLLPASAKVWGAREFLNRRFEPFGSMTNLQIDPAKRTATLELELKGETQPLKVNIQKYELTTVDGKTILEIKEVQTSREWLNLLLAELGRNGKLKFEVPEAIRAVL